MGKELTIIEVCEWELLFEGEQLVDQGHSICLMDIVSRAKGNPVVLRHVNAEGSALDEETYESGDVSYDMTLSGALAKCVGARRMGFTS